MPKRTPEEPRPELKVPSDTETEKIVLGAVLLGSQFSSVREILRIDDFFLRAHQLLFGCMAELESCGEPIDITTVASALIRSNSLDALRQGSEGGLTVLSSMASAVPRLENLTAYCRIVKTKAIERRTIAAIQITGRSLLKGLSDIGPALERLESDVQSLRDEVNAGNREEGRSPIQIVETFPGGINAFLDPTTQPKGLMTGFHKLDDLMGGFKGGQLIILGAFPKSGKTSLALNITENIIFRDPPELVAFFSLEMPAPSLLARIIVSRSQVPRYKFDRGFCNPEERRRLQLANAELMDAPFAIFDRSSRTMSQIRAQAIGAVKRGAKLIVVDYLTLIASAGRRENRNQEIGEYTRIMKQTALELDVPFLVLSQLSRPSKEKIQKPTETWLRDSGEIEQNADAILLIWREEMFRKNVAELHGKAEVIVARQREGPDGTAKLRFIGKCTRFENPTEEDEKSDANEASQ